MPRRSRQLFAALGMALALAVGTPVTASADDFWGLWARELKERPWWEVPFATLFSFPAMVVTTPFWAGTEAWGAMKGRGGSSDDDY